MKNKKILILLILSLFCIKNVYAQNYIDASRYDFINGWETVNLGLGDNSPLIQKAIPVNDGVILLADYWEDKSKFKDNDFTIPGIDEYGNATAGTSVRSHAKIAKLDLNLNKMWEKNLSLKGYWENADEVADTVTTKLTTAAELSDGSIVVGGYTWGHVDNDDDFVALVARYNKDGDQIYLNGFETNGFNQQYPGTVKDAILVKATTDGGYVIKYAAYIDVNKSETAWYVAYDSSNNIKEIIPNGERSKLSSYSYIENNAINDLMYTQTQRTDDNYWYERYIGTDIAGDIYFKKTNGKTNTSYKTIDIYDSSKSSLKKQYNLVTDVAIQQNTSLMTSTNELFVTNALYDKNGNVLSNYSLNNSNPTGEVDQWGKTKQLNGEMTVLSNGYVINTGINKYNNIRILKPSDNNGDFANIIIDGELVKQNLGIYVENDRTYISLNNLCNVMGCTFSRGEKNNNRLILKFPLFKNNKNMMVDKNISNAKNVENIRYTIVHEIGSKNYDTYLEIFPNHVFILKSPTFNSESIDVTSLEKDGQIYVPLRFIAEAMGRYVNYEPKGENGKPNITISALGEGDFYEKYKTIVSFSEYADGDDPNDIISENTIELKCEGKKLFAYGLDVANNKIISKEHTVYVPIYAGVIGDKKFEYNGQNENHGDDYKIKGRYYSYYFGFEALDNSIQARTQEILHSTGDINNLESYTDIERKCGGNVETYWIVSNIEGYPFLKLINLSASN